ncbi:MAG: VWA domain-containing protein, partial [Chloroflexi bacterium]|nr:VWA domain-containing protein [Chloroflexota bacterium]
GARPATTTGVLVTVTGRISTFFANVFGVSELSATAQGGGGFSPLDVMVVLDISGSMDDDSCLLKGVTSPNPISLNTHFDTSGKCSGVVTGDGLSSSNCGNCKGTWGGTNKCTWPGGTTMGSEVTAICGSVQTSSSLCTACKGVWVTPPQPIDALRVAAGSFVDLVQAQLGPTDPHMGLVSYSTTSTRNVNLTSTLSTVKSAITALAAVGYTNCEAGLYDARVELTTSGRQRWTAAKVILFMSDGQANRCRTESSCTQARAKQLAIAEATTAASLGIQVYTIGLGVDSDTTTLQQMATVGGGAYQYAATGADLSPAFTTLFQKIKRLRLVQ